MQITETQIAQVNNQIQALLKAESFYGKKLEEAGVTSIQSAEDFQKLPFSEKNDLRNAACIFGSSGLYIAFFHILYLPASKKYRSRPSAFFRIRHTPVLL